MVGITGDDPGPAPVFRIEGRPTVTRRYAACVTVLAILVIYFLIWPVWRAQFLIEIWPTEAWNAYFQDAAAAGRPLYPSADQLIQNNYPPLSFYAIGYLGRLFGDNLFVGRAVSVIALLCVSVEIFFAIRILVGGVIGAAGGALWYAAMMAHSSELYIGTNDPQLAGEAIMMAALVWFLARDRDGKSAQAPLLLMVIAGFWKHNIVAIPVTAIGWLLLRDGKRATRPLLVSAAAAAGGLLLCTAIFGRAFPENLFATREYAWAHVVGHLGHLQWSALALVIWASWAWSDRASRAARFTALHVATGFCTCILQWFGHGVGRNAEFDLIIALGIGIGVALERIETSLLARRIGIDGARDLLLLALILRLILSDRQGSALVLLSPEFRSLGPKAQQMVRNEADRVAAIPGDVFCSNKVVCRAAGKPFVVDEFKTEELVATGKATAAEISALLRDRHISVFISDRNTSASSIATSLSSNWQTIRPLAGSRF
ncbi:MAG: glycosyltransferase family 39 protein [Bradyrhizobium sp.]